MGLVLGIIALVQIGNAQGELTGKGLALAAVIISALPVPLGMCAAIAIPNFVRYQLRSKTAEARVNLASIRVAQESAKSRFGRYLKAEPSAQFVDMTKQLWGAMPCEASCSQEAADTCTSFDCMGFKPEGDVYYAYACEASEDGMHYTCAALGDLDGDGEYSLFVYGTGQNELVAPIPDFGGQSPGCLKSVANQVIDCSLPGTY